MYKLRPGEATSGSSCQALGCGVDRHSSERIDRPLPIPNALGRGEVTPKRYLLFFFFIEVSEMLIKVWNGLNAFKVIPDAKVLVGGVDGI